MQQISGAIKNLLERVTRKHNQKIIRFDSTLRFRQSSSLPARESHYSDRKSFCKSLFRSWVVHVFQQENRVWITSNILNFETQTTLLREDRWSHKEESQSSNLTLSIHLFEVPVSKSLEKSLLCRSRQSVRRLLRATQSVRFRVVLLLVGSRAD